MNNNSKLLFRCILLITSLTWSYEPQALGSMPYCQDSIDDNLSISSCIIEDSTFRDLSPNFKLNNVLYKNSTIQMAEFLTKDTVNTCAITNSIIDLSFLTCTIDSLILNNCEIKSLQFNSCKINHLEIRDCNVRMLKILNVESQMPSLSHFKLIGGKVVEMIVFGVEVNDMEIGQCTMGLAKFENCSLNSFKLSELSFLSNSKISFDNSTLVLPDIETNNLDYFDFIKMRWPRNFKLKNEVDGRKDLFGETINRHKLEQARDIYFFIAEQARINGLKEKGRFFEYRKKEMERFLLTDAWTKGRYFFEKYFGGKYGQYPDFIILVFCVIWALFTFIYWYISSTNRGWALVCQKDFYKNTEVMKAPHFIHRSDTDFAFAQIKTLCTYSLDQLSLLGLNRIGITGQKSDATTIIPIGIGYLVSKIENAIGLILIFNFIQGIIYLL